MRNLAHAYLSQASANALAKYRAAVRPVYGVTNRGDPDHIGSAVLVELHGCKCLVTAAHVIDQNAYTSLYLGADDFALLEFDALVTHAPAGDRGNDHADFAVAPLSAVDVAKLSKAVFISEADFSDRISFSQGGAYTCLGFPNSKNKVNPHKSNRVVPMLGNYSSSARPAAQLPNIATDRDHVLVDYDGKRARDQDGEIVPAYAFRGFSGGAIIDLGQITSAGFSLRDDPKLAAIFIEGHKAEHVILGTRLSTIVTTVHGKLSADREDLRETR